MERPLMGGIVRQHVGSQMLCLSDLANIYEAERVSNGWTEKRLDLFFKNDAEKEYIMELLKLQGVLIDDGIPSFTEHANNKGVISALKSIGQYSTKGRGENRNTFCNPYIFVAVAQWLNPKFRAYVTMWVTDQLILNRIEAGNNFNTLCDAISINIIPKLSSDNAKRFIYSNFTKLINKKVFGRHEDNLRQIASKDQLNELNRLETKLSTLIEVGYISSYSDAKVYINQTK